MDWPIAEELCALWSLPKGYRNGLLTRAEIPVLIESIKHWHRDIAVGVGSSYPRADFYTEKVCLAGRRDRDVIVVLTMYGDEVVARGGWEREQDALTRYARFEAISPGHRGAKLTVRAMDFGKHLARSMGRASSTEKQWSRAWSSACTKRSTPKSWFQATN